MECSRRILNNVDICVTRYDTETHMCMMYTSCFSPLIDVSNTETFLIHRDLSVLRPRDCSDIHPGSLSGVYTIYSTDEQFDVNCDIDTAGPGWFSKEERTELSTFTRDGDSLMIPGTRNHNGMMFSTKDRDNDRYSAYNCAQTYKGAWCHKACHYANLNGAYLGAPHLSFADGIEWFTWKGYHYSLKSTKMMFKGN
ncbi:unnamed protein product [Mytilus coruscus]|uniref:Fibrinogen C-terminal domain-containing protein n=1 Tax=Mytilus coruscus TaxID=42192 RepID=A0A6J8A0C4_MYTCO|nr:unnamed protein product [Mytilus coruscus]